MNELNNKCKNHLKDYKKYCIICKKHFCEDDIGCEHENEMEEIKMPQDNDKKKIKDYIEKLKIEKENDEYIIKLLETMIETAEKHPSNYFNNINIKNVSNINNSNCMKK